MGFFFIFLFCLFFFFLLPPIYGKNSCRSSVCGKNTFPVKFPFQLQDQKPTSCGYPGFDLGCNKQGIVTLKLPRAEEEFFVRSIDYLRQEIKLYDPSGCVAKRLHKLNLSGSPFKATAYMKFSILSCSSQTFPVSSSLAVVCLSNSTNTVIAVGAGVFSFQCPEFFGVPIQVPRTFQANNNIFSQFSQLGDDIPLRWNVPDCGACESRGRTCGFAYNSSRVTCQHRTGNRGLQVLGIVSFSVAFCVFAVFSIICFIKVRRMHDGRTNTATTAQARNFDPAAVAPRPVNVVAGLDETSISSYTKVVLGESCRLPGGTNDGACPICLSEYTAEETVKCLPECKHCFHVDCIDEWLRLTGTCPICRSLTPSSCGS